MTGRDRPSAPVLLAGWLFADLLLGLTVTMLGAQAPPPVPEAGRGTASPTPSPSPCATRIAGVKARPLKLAFRVDPGASDGELLAVVRRELRGHRERLTGRRAGMVLTFGAAGGAGDGVHLAKRVNAAARRAYPRVFGTAATRNFHDLAAPRGSISMEIYFVSVGCSPTPGS